METGGMQDFPNTGMGEQYTQVQNNESPKKIGKFRASLGIVKASWNLLKKDKEVMVFPIISAAVIMMAMLIIAGAFFFLVIGTGGKVVEEGSNSSMIVNLIFAFIFYFTVTFITLFFESAIIAVVMGRMRGQDLTFFDGIGVAFNKIGKIFYWSLLSATVGTVLKFISDRSKLLGKLIVSILGAAWSILTFFIAPVMVVEDLPVKESLKKSASIIKNVWGEAVIVNIGVGFFFGIISLFGMVLFFASLFVFKFEFIIISLTILIVFLLSIAVISSTLNVIFRVVLYEYASSGKISDGFSQELMSVAFNSKK